MAREGPKGKSTKAEERSPNPVDVHVGSRVRFRRLYLDMSQSKLARELGLTFQQIQKYERGLNRISASRLYDLTRVLDVPVSFFFDDMPEELRRDKPVGDLDRGTGASDQTGLVDPMSHRATVDLVRAYYRIPDPTLRKRIYEITKALAAGAESSSDVSAVPPFIADDLEESNGAENGC